jgi:uncharacterized membrane protein
MNQLFVIGFDTEDAARDAMASLRKVESQGAIHFEDTAVVTRDAEGNAHVKNELSGATETGAAIGGLVGTLIAGFLFPVVGLALGAVVGGAIGAITHSGVDKGFVEQVKQELKPGTSALFLVTKEANAAALAGALRPYTGRVIQTTVDDDLEDTLKEALR